MAKSKIIVRLLRALVWSLVSLFLLAVLSIGADMVLYRFYGYPPITQFVLHELPFRGEKFTPQKWLEANGNPDYDYSCFRGGMVRNLTKSHLNVGPMNRAQVESLLGPQDYEISINENICAGYALGWCSGFGLDPDSLYVCFDDQGLLNKSGTHQH